MLGSFRNVNKPLGRRHACRCLSFYDAGISNKHLLDSKKLLFLPRCWALNNEVLYFKLNIQLTFKSSINDCSNAVLVLSSSLENFSAL